MLLKKIMIGLGLFGLSQTTFAKLDLELPDLDLPTSYSSPQTTVNQTQRLKTLRKLRGHYSVIEDPELNRWLRHLGNKISRQSSVHHKVSFLLVKNPEINAFATEGGVIVINSGLVLHTSTESELAAVIAHEIAHVSQNHLSRIRADSKRHIIGTGAAILAGIVAGTQNPNAGSAIITTAMAGQQHKALSFSREMESEADRVGLRLLSQAGFRPSGMPDFMEKLDRLNDSTNAQLTKYLLSHPLSIDRLSDTRARANRLPNRGHESIDYLYAREKLRAIDTRSIVSTGRIPPAVTQYSKAQKFLARSQYRQALQVLGVRAQRLPQLLAIAKALNGTRQYQQTVNLLQPHIRTYIGEPAILVPLCNALVSLGRADEAWKHINTVVPTEDTSLEFFEVKQEVAKHSRHTGEAFIAAAQRNIRIGEVARAKQQLQQAIKLSSVSAHEVAKIQRLLAHL